MSLLAEITANKDERLTEMALYETLKEGLAGQFSGQKVLVLIPKQPNGLPMPTLFRTLVEALSDTEKLDFMVAVGNTTPLQESRLRRLVGMSDRDKVQVFPHIGLVCHKLESQDDSFTLEILSELKLQGMLGEVWHPSLGGELDVRLNKRILEYDHTLILGPVAPHPIFGFSGGVDAIFPGIADASFGHFIEWLGAQTPTRAVIGTKTAPARDFIHQVADLIPMPITLIAPVVVGEGVVGMFVGDHRRAWEMAVNLSAKRHTVALPNSFRRALAVVDPNIRDLASALDAVYMLEAVITAGGEIVIYAPNIETYGGEYHKEVMKHGCHVRDYFLQQWDNFYNVPRTALAQSVRLCGDGVYEDGEENARIRVTLATSISEAECAKLSLGFYDHNDITITEWMEIEEEGILYVPNAGEQLYLLGN